MTDEPAGNEWVTIAEAARRIGVQERSLRRVIAREPYADRTRQEERETRTGRRRTVLVPSALLTDLSDHFERWKTQTEDGQGNAAKTRRSPDSPTRTEGGLIAAYAQMIEGKDAEIARLVDRIEFLEAALQREQENVAREQALRTLMLPPPPGPQESATDSETERVPQVAPEVAEIGAQQARRSPWWRFWARE